MVAPRSHCLLSPPLFHSFYSARLKSIQISSTFLLKLNSLQKMQPPTALPYQPSHLAPTSTIPILLSQAVFKSGPNWNIISQDLGKLITISAKVGKLFHFCAEGGN